MPDQSKVNILYILDYKPRLYVSSLLLWLLWEWEWQAEVSVDR